MKPILKYSGGKEKELSIIKNNLPVFHGRFIEPFVGGGSVFFAMDNKKCYINDKSYGLINLYRCIGKQDINFKHYLQKENDEFWELGFFIRQNKSDIFDLYNQELSVEDFMTKYLNFFKGFADNYNDIFLREIKRNLKNKIKRSSTFENNSLKISKKSKLDNIEAALKSAYYMFLRYLYNNSFKISFGRYAAVYYFIHEYCYSSMSRYNKDNEFNVPYGGISYNNKNFQQKIDYILSDEVGEKISTAGIFCEDFETFLNTLDVTKDDFLFVDPPYDSTFSTYDNNEFSHAEQIRLCNYLKHLPAKIMLIIKHTDFICNLYKDNFTITGFDKQYMVNFKNRNERNTRHLLITNY